MSATFDYDDGMTICISDAGHKRLSDEALRRLAADNAQRVASSYIYEITAGAGLGGAVVAIVWMLVKANTGV